MTSMADEPYDKEVDELEDEFLSDDENDDPNVFKVSHPLTPPSAMSYSAQELHSEGQVFRA